MNPVYTGEFPDYVLIFGGRAAVRSGFRDIIKIASMLSDGETPSYLKPILALRMFFCDSPETLYEKFGGDTTEFSEFINVCSEAMAEFLSGRRAKTSAHGGKRGLSLTVPYDFDEDAELIFAAFMQTYGVDLAVEDMHWHKFRALFKGLSKETEFARIAGIRTADVSGISDQARRAEMRRLKARYSLKADLSGDDKARVLGESLSF